MQTHWFYTVWPFIGIGGAIVMVAILLMTDTFRGNTTVSRWRGSRVAGVAGRTALLGASVRGIQPACAGLRLLNPGNDLPEDWVSALSGLPNSAGLLPSGEHRSHVVRGATCGVPLQPRRL